jgi:hypothetical protein
MLLLLLMMMMMLMMLMMMMMMQYKPHYYNIFLKKHCSNMIMLDDLNGRVVDVII